MALTLLPTKVSPAVPPSPLSLRLRSGPALLGAFCRHLVVDQAQPLSPSLSPSPSLPPSLPPHLPRRPHGLPLLRRDHRPPCLLPSLGPGPLCQCPAGTKRGEIVSLR